MHTSRHLTAALIVLVSASTSALADDIVEVRRDADRLMHTLDALPYAPQGEGPVLYTLEFSECPHSQRFHREWKGRLDGVQVRRVLFATSQRTANETAALARSRSAADYDAFMEGRKQAPRVDDPALPDVEYNRNADLFNSVMHPLTQIVRPILQQNGVISAGIVSPMLIWQEGERVFAAGGYGPEHVAGIVQRVAATQTATAGDTELAAAPQAASTRAGSAAGEGVGQVAGGQTSGATAAPSAGGPDVVGLRLGMTKDEVIAALRAHDSRLRITETPLRLTARDSASQTFEAVSFVSEVQAGHTPHLREHSAGEPIELIVAVFAGPPAAHRVVYLERNVQYALAASPAFDGVVASIIEKYGPPPHRGDERENFLGVWPDAGTPVTQQDLVRWRQTSRARAVLQEAQNNSVYNAVQRTLGDPDLGRKLEVYVQKHGHGAFRMKFLLSESQATLRQLSEDTSNLVAQLLEQHEQALRIGAQERRGPRL